MKFTPTWSVTWPTRPAGVDTRHVRATDPTDAVRVAAEDDWATNPGYTVAFDYTPEVWRLHRPARLLWRFARHATGPLYDDGAEAEAFAPLPA